MVLRGNDRLDALTGLWSLQAAGEIITHYLNTEDMWGKDALLLMEITGADGRAADSVLQDTASCLLHMLRRTDIAARAGDHCFLVFLLGCHSRGEVERLVSGVGSFLSENTGCSLHAGAVISDTKEYPLLMRQAKAELFCAKKTGDALCVAEDLKENGTEESAWEFGAVPEYVRDTGVADMEFIRELMDFFCGKEESGTLVTQSLSILCRYFGASVAYIIERKHGGKGYELTFNGKEAMLGVVNRNLREIPSLVGDRYLEQLAKLDVLVCSRIQDLEKLDPIIAERQKMRDSRSLLQCPIMESGEAIGYISMNDSRYRVWNRREVMTFFLAAQVITARILPLRFQRFARILMDYDHLTEAWNYNRFLAEGKRRLCNSTLLQAVVTMDIRNFKVINISFSYEKGNAVLMHISSLLSSFTGGGECFARIEADKFILLLEYQSISGLLHRLNQLIRRLEQIPKDEGLDFDIRCVMGVCLVEPGDQDMSVLADHANAARKTLKDFHKSAYRFYNRDAEQKIVREQEMTFRMRGALNDREFIVYYQPKISLEKQTFIGLEALVRWKAKDGRIIPPDEFIPVFEKNGFISDLDSYVYERVCELIASWMEDGLEPLPIAVNISRMHIVEPDFLEGLLSISRRLGVPERYLELEITESAFLNNTETVLKAAKEIKNQGFSLAMDDFGTGYSSLSLLKELPVDVIKLDREFFRKTLNSREKIIVSNVIHMAKELDIQVISEGIETDEHELFLKEIGCDLAQGYRYGRPAPIEQYLSAIYGDDREVWKKKS